MTYGHLDTQKLEYSTLLARKGLASFAELMRGVEGGDTLDECCV